MTGPFVPIRQPGQLLREQGPGSQAYTDEYAAAIERVNQLYNQYSQQLNPGMAMTQQGAPQVPTGIPSQPAGPQWTDEDLVQAGVYWGLPEAGVRAMPRQAVIDYVNQHREASRAKGIDPMAVETAPGKMALIGAGKGLTNLVQDTPMPGAVTGFWDWVARGQVKKDWEAQSSIVKAADQKLRQMEEAVRASVPEEMGKELSAAYLVGNFGSMVYPGVAAWSVAGNVGRVVPWMSKASPIGRAAFQGGLSSYLLAGGTDEADEQGFGGRWGHRAMVTGAGVVLGAGAKYLEKPIGDLVQRVTKSYVSPTLASPKSATVDTPLDDMEIPANVQNMGPFPAEGFQGAAPDSHIMRLRALAANGDEQAQAMLDYMGGAQGMGVPMGPGNIPPSMEGVVAKLQQQAATGDAAAQRALDDIYWQFDARPRPTAAPAPVTAMPDGQPVPPGMPEDVLTQIAGPEYLPQQGLARGATNTPVAGLAPEGSPYAPEVGLRPERNPQGLPTVGLARGATNTPVRGLRPEYDPLAGVTGRAEALAAQMNKVATVVSSPEFPQISGQTQLDDSAVAFAALTENPGGSNVVQGITDPASFVQKLGQNVAFAKRGTRLDALISDQPLSAGQVGQYETFGMYSGQRVLTSDGVAATVEGIGLDGEVLLSPIYAGTPMKRPIGDLHPLVTSPGKTEVPQLWDMFKVYTTQKAAEVQVAMGGALGEDQLSAVTSKNMALWMEGFLDDLGVHGPGDRNRIAQYFNERWVDDFRFLAPQETAYAQSVNAQANMAAVEAIATRPPVQQLDQAAATKGFRVIPVNEGKWQVEDMVGATRQQQGVATAEFESEEAALAFIKNFDRSGSMPDVTPESPIPLETISTHPTGPTSLPNQNETLAQRAAAAVDDLDALDVAAGGAGGGGDFPPTAQLAAEGRSGELFNRRIQKYMKFMPARRLVSNLDEILHEYTGGKISGVVAAGFERLDQAVQIMHSAQTPMRADLRAVTSKIRTRFMTSGQWARTYEILDDAERLVVAKRIGMNAQEIASFDEFEALQMKWFELSGLDDSRWMRRYLSHVSQRQSRAETVGTAFEDFPLPESAIPFYEMAREGNLNFRELDPRILGDIYVRALTWKKHMAPTWDPFAQTVNAMAQSGDEVIAQVGKIMSAQTKLVKYGYNPTEDPALDTAWHAMQALLGPEITRTQARQLFSGGLNTVHQAMMGWNPSAIFRDMHQVFLAVPRAGQELLTGYRSWMTNPAFRKQVMQEAVSEGVVSLQTTGALSPGAVSSGVEGEAMISGLAAHTEQSGWRVRALSKIAEKTRDALPEAARDHMLPKLGPMYFYGKQSEITRSLVYNAGKQKAASAIAAYKKDGSVENLLVNSAMKSYDPAWQREFVQLVSAGSETEAIQFAGRQLAHSTMFDYGIHNSPWIGKSMTGRLAMQFGNYPMQLFQYYRETLSNGMKNGMPTANLMKTVGLTAATWEALRYGQEKTGWRLTWLNPFTGIAFTGGPTLEALVDVGQGVSAFAQALTNPDVASTGPVMAGVSAVGTLANQFNPTRGLWRTAQGIGQGLNSPLPGQAIARHFITGEIGAGPDINNVMLPQVQESYQRMLQSIQTPNRASGIGLPPGYFPQQPVTVPPQLQDPQQIPSVAIDTTPLAFAPPSLDRASVYNYQDVVAAFRGDPGARSLMTQDEVRQLDQLRGLPVDVAMAQFRAYLSSRMANQPYMVSPGGIRP